MKEQVKSRRDKRKEARVAKNQHKYQSWISHQKVQGVKKKVENSKTKTLKDHNTSSQDLNGRNVTQSDVFTENMSMLGEKNDVKVKPVSSSKEGRKENKTGKRKTKFEEFLEMTMPGPAMSVEDDIKLEKRLAKKLKVKKGGKLPGLDDELNELLDGVPSFMGNLSEDEILNAEKSYEDSFEDSAPSKKCVEDFLEEVSEDDMEADQEIEQSMTEAVSDAEISMEESLKGEGIEKREKKRRKSKKKKEHDVILADELGVNVTEAVESPAMGETKEEAPLMTSVSEVKTKYVAPHMRNVLGNESQENVQFRRRVRGLLNRLSESNVESITGEISAIFHSVSRSVASQIISEEIIASCSGGPRGNEQYAAVFGAFVAGMACSVGMDFSAKLLASLAKSFENEYLNEDNLSLRNLTLLLSYLCIFGVCSSDLIYDFLIMLSKRLTEVDVSTILTILQCCGMKIRGDDPAFMKSFIQSVQNKVNELKAAPGECQGKINSKRMEFMLETICDIKNNKRRHKEDSAQHTRMKKWLQKLKVEDILIRGLTWSKLLDTNKKGQWWLLGDMVSKAYNVEEVASTIDKEAVEAQKMLQLASAQRMNTDARKAIFCIIMSGEDYIDAFEKLLRLNLHGKQDREIMRVVVECCLQEKVFNKYYTALALKLCEHDKNHKFTLQFCLWDHFKELESMHLQRLMHLAKFMAEMVASFSLSIAVLKAVDFTDPVQLTPKRIMHFRMFFEAMFERPKNIVWNTFTRVAVAPELETLRNGMEFFMKEYVVRTNRGVTEKYKVAKKALNNVEGVLM